MENNWKAICIQLADEECPEKREIIISEVRNLAAAEEHTRKMRFSKDAHRASEYARDYSQEAKAIGIEMQGMADDRT